VVDVLGLIGRGQHDNAQRLKTRMGAHPAEDGEAIAVGHADIKQHEIWNWEFRTILVFTPSFQIGNRFLAASDDLKGVRYPGSFQSTQGEQDVIFSIFNQQNDTFFR